MNDLSQRKCIPCGTHTKAFTREEAEKMQSEVANWTLDDAARVISKSYAFKNFAEAMAAANMIGDLAEREGHHPDLHVSWGKLVVDLSTHSIGGLTVNDFILAAKIDALALDK